MLSTVLRVGALQLSPAQIDQLWAAGQTLAASQRPGADQSADPALSRASGVEQSASGQRGLEQSSSGQCGVEKSSSGQCDPGVVLWFRKQVQDGRLWHRTVLAPRLLSLVGAHAKVQEGVQV